MTKDVIVCRSMSTFADLLGPPNGTPSAQLPWETICDEVVCITTQKAGQKRWKFLKRALEHADLARLVTLLVNTRPCDLQGRSCELIDACFASHFCIIQKAQEEKLRSVLILEDDVYFDVEGLPRAIEKCRSFLEADLPFSAFLFGGVYTEMSSTEVDGVYKGRGMQAHAWLVNVRHPVWNVALDSGHRMQDVYNHEHGETYMVYPDVAFQKDFSAGEGKRPTYNLAEMPPLYRALTSIGLRFGMRNCWEGCARRTNAIVRTTGSIKAALVTLGVLVGVLSCAIVIMACTWAAKCERALLQTHEPDCAF